MNQRRGDARWEATQGTHNEECTSRTMAVVWGLQARMVGKTTLRMEKTTGSVHMRTSSSQSCADSHKLAYTQKTWPHRMLKRQPALSMHRRIARRHYTSWNHLRLNIFALQRHWRCATVCTMRTGHAPELGATQRHHRHVAVWKLENSPEDILLLARTRRRCATAHALPHGTCTGRSSHAR